MKKVSIIICTLLILSMTGCSSNESNTALLNTGINNYDTSSAAATNMPVASSESQNTSSKKEAASIKGVISDYNVVKTSFDKNSNDIKVFFPQINGLSDKTKQAKINELIKNVALIADLREDVSWIEWYNLDYDVIWSSNNLLSILLTGNCYAKKAAHPFSFCNTINIDMKTGELIKLSDIVNVNSDFVQLLINKSQLVDGRGTIDFTAIKKDYFNKDDLKTAFENDETYYFTSTGLVFSVSTAHVIGDYALFSLNFSDISKYFKQKSQWENIKSDFPSTNLQIIREQCFKTSLTGFGSMWFVSGFKESSNGVLKSLKFYLLGNDGNVKYEFPDFNSSNLGYYGIRAIAFKDVNHDGENDVIIITALNKGDEVEYDEVKVYLSDKNKFVMDNNLNSYISKNLLKGTKTVSDVLGAAKNYFK